MVEVRYLGRFGNNLFQYCFGRILAENLGFKLKVEPISGFPNTKSKVDWYDYSSGPTQILMDWQGQLQTFFVEDSTDISVLCNRIGSGKIQDIANRQNTDLESILQDRTKRKIIVCGYFQRYEYYEGYKDKIRKNWLKTNMQMNEQVGENDIVVVVRRGDFVPKHSLPFGYFEEVISMANFDRMFVCSDDTKDPFLELFKKYKAIIHPTNPLENFKFIMSFKKIIQSDSTFSWWASFLSNAKEIYFPLSLHGYWIDGSNGIDLKVDESRYNYIKCKEIYKESVAEKILTLRGRLRRKIHQYLSGIKKRLKSRI